MPYIFKYIPTGETIMYTWDSAMHTRLDIILKAKATESYFIDVVNRIMKEIDHLEKIGNCFDEKSELSTINRMNTHEVMSISSELYDILQSCIDYNHRTEGLFDITVDTPSYTPHTVRSIHLLARPIITLDSSPIKINLSGFLKGYALDKIKNILKSHHFHNALINLGNSSIMAMGNLKRNEGWNLQLQKTNLQQEHIILNNECMTTSGNHFLGRRDIYSPISQKYLTGKYEVSVITESGALGEVMSTCICLSNELQKKQFIRNFNIRKIFEKGNRTFQ